MSRELGWQSFSLLQYRPTRTGRRSSTSETCAQAPISSGGDRIPRPVGGLSTKCRPLRSSHVNEDLRPSFTSHRRSKSDMERSAGNCHPRRAQTGDTDGYYTCGTARVSKTCAMINRKREGHSQVLLATQHESDR